MTIEQFYRLTWQEYNWLCEAESLKQELKWTHTREVLAMMYNANRGKNSAVKSGKDFIKLSFDVTEEIKPLSLDEHKELLKKFGLNG